MKRWMIVGGLSMVLALTGCSKTDTPTENATNAGAGSPTTAAGSPTTKTGGPTATFALNDCVAVASANLGLIGGDATDGEKIKSYNPPKEVADAVDTLVAEGGLKVSAENQDKAEAASKTISDWVTEVCPKS